jgi:hypothetical protein
VADKNHEQDVVAVNTADPVHSYNTLFAATEFTATDALRSTQATAHRDDGSVRRAIFGFMSPAVRLTVSW